MEPAPSATTLFVADLPYDVSEQDFVMTFESAQGFKGARLRRDRNDNVVGFVDFIDHPSAQLALEQFQGYSFDESSEGINIQFSYGSTARPRRSSRAPEQGYRSRHDGRVGALPLNGLPMMMPMPGMHADAAMPYYNMPSTFSYNALAYPPLPADANSTLFVEGLPGDATEREVAHIFRPYPGFLSLRILAKESKQYPNRNYVLCFVEFENRFQATIAIQALQSYKMDKNDTKGLIISYAKPSSRKERTRKTTEE